MKHTAKIELANNDELVLVNAGIMNPEDVKQITVEDALSRYRYNTSRLTPLPYRTTRLNAISE